MPFHRGCNKVDKSWDLLNNLDDVSSGLMYPVCYQLMCFLAVHVIVSKIQEEDYRVIDPSNH